MKNLTYTKNLLILRPCFSPKVYHIRFLSGEKDGPEKGKAKDEVADNINKKKILNIDPKDIQNKHLAKPISFDDAREAAQKAYELQKRHLEDRVESLKAIFSGKPDTPRTPNEEWYYKRVSFWMKRYENFVGLTEVKAAQARVVECEKNFILMQERRREAQANISEVQKKIKEIHLELEKTHRGEDRYLVLVTQEHNVLKEERNHLEEFKSFEKGEREYFSALSNAVRDSHEKERAQAEKTKYWSVLGSILGTCLGILGTTINNRMRMNELRRLVAKNSTVEEVQAIGEELTTSLDAHEKELSKLTVQVEHILNQAKSSLGNLNKVDGVLTTLQESGEKINTKFLEESLKRVESRQDALSQLISKHEQVMDEKIEAIKSDIFVQNTNVGKLAHIQLKDRERDQQVSSERETFLKKSVEFINKQNVDLQQMMNNYSKEIDDKIKDVRSLLLNEHRLPKFESKIMERLSSLEKGHSQLLQVKNAPAVTVNDANITDILESHHQRTRQTVILSTLMVAVLTPLAVYAVNHVL